MRLHSLLMRSCVVCLCLVFFVAYFGGVSASAVDYQPVVDPAPGYSIVLKPSYYDFTIGIDGKPAIVDQLTNGNYRVKGSSSGDSIVGLISKSSTSVEDYLKKFTPGDELQYSFSFVSPDSAYLPKFVNLVVFFGSSDGKMISFDSYYKLEHIQANMQYIGTIYISPPDNCSSIQLCWQFSGDYSSEGQSNVLPVIYFRDGYLSPYGDTLSRLQQEQNQKDIIGSDSNEESASGLKGILLWIKNIPSKIGELLKNLFIPSEDEIQNFKDDTEELLSTRLGVVWESGELIYNTAVFFYMFTPDVTPSLTFPAFNFNMSDKGEFSEGSKSTGTNFKFWDKQVLKFDFLNERPYKQLYELYKICVCAMLVCIVIRFAYRKGEKILTGSSD